MNLSKRQRMALLVLLPPEEIKTKTKQLPQNHTPLWKHWQTFISRQLALGKSPISLKSVRDGIRTLLRHTSLCSIEHANDRCLVSDLLYDLRQKRNFSAITRNTYLKNLNSYLIWLEKRNIIDTNHLRKAEKATEPIREQPCQTKREIEQVLHYIRTRKYQIPLGRYRDLLLVWLLSFTGARTCELINMHVDDCYQTKKGWQIRVCGRKQKARVRYFSCPQHIQEIYSRYMDIRLEQGIHCPTLFVSLKSKSPWTAEGAKKLFCRIERATGIKFSGHRVRRFVATRLNEEGFNIKEISRYLGHQRTSTTELYIARTGALTEMCAKLMAQEFSP